MATIKVCDFCKGYPDDYDAKSGGDVRTVTLNIEGVSEGGMGCPVQERRFDACAPCRTRLLGEIFDNISARPPLLAKESRRWPIPVYQ